MNDLLGDGNSPRELRPGQPVGDGRFTLFRRLGQGRMGVIWLAQDAKIDQLVALKVVPPEVASDRTAMKALRRETEKGKRLIHPNIVRIHDLFELPGEPVFIAMEHVDGPNLNTVRLEQSYRFLTWKFLEPLAKQLCDALEYAHGERVLHGDLKPSSLILDAQGQLKIADFGLVAVGDSRHGSSSRRTAGEARAYLSPQQLDSGITCVSDDIYAVGVTLYELLASYPPFFGDNIIEQIRQSPPRPLAKRIEELELRNKVPAWVCDFILACLAKEPGQRSQSASELVDALEGPVQEPEPVPEVPEIKVSLLQKLRDWLTPTKILLLALAVLLGLFAALHLWLRSHRV